MNVQEILKDWKFGLTHKEIKDRHGLTDNEEFAITECSDGLSIQEIQQRLTKLKPSDTGRQIKEKMQIA